MALPAFDPFEALGLPRDASEHVIKERYHYLSRKYHPNRHQGSDESKATLSEHFHNVHQAWKVLSQADSRRRRVELLNLLELQDEMLTQFVELLSADTPEEKHDHHASDVDGHVSSDADEDLPNVGLQRRQTFKDFHGTRHLGDRRQSIDTASPTSPTKKTLKWSLSKLTTAKKQEQQKEADYFTQRRKKLEKLRRKELEAFLEYRDAMVAKFEAEEIVETQYEEYERAKWKREYFERAPRGTTERFRSFQHAMSAVTAFENHAPRNRNRSTLSNYSVMSPTVGPGEGPKFLDPEHAISRQKTAHRRGWSSDISGDQTDSSEDESTELQGSRKISPPGNFHQPPMRHGKLVTFENFKRHANGKHAVAIEQGGDSPGPFKLVVRQPTDLGTIVEAHDSSGETPSGSSRSPSPQPVTGTELAKFTVVPSSGTADIFGVPPERRARSRSPAGHGRSPSPTPSEPEQRRLVHDGCRFETKHIGPPEHHHVPISHVHLLSRQEKSDILGAEPDTELDPSVLLQRLSSLDPRVASRFEVKPDMEEMFNFRLIYGNREVTSRQHQSFIALSYRRKLHVERHSTHYTLPLEPEIFQAVWDERQSDSEGVWIDQICIDQDSDIERTISMSAMDMVYRSARVVVVALDDIELDQFEGELLQNHMDEYSGMTHVAPRHRFRRKQPPYLETHEDLYKVVRKMLRSSWFKRAWCRHEMRLAKHHVFLIPCKRAGTWGGRDVLRFNGKCIAHLLDLCVEVPFEPDVESVKPALHGFFRDRAKMAENERQMRLHHGNFSTVVAEVFAMEAGGDPRIPAEQRLSDARKDKISIILNTLECGLSLHEGVRDPSDPRYNITTDNQCFHDLSLLALAAQDPGALCSVGAPLPITEDASSWVYMPTVADSGLNNFKTLERLPANARFVTHTSGSEHFIQLDMRFLKRTRNARASIDPDMIDLARHFMNVCDERKWGRNRKRYLIHDRKANLLFGPMKEVYIETLACVFHCGPDWMSDVCRRYSMSRWKVDLQPAWQLLIALQNTHGRWPADSWDERAAAFIADFVNFLVIRGLPQRQISKPEPWRPLWVSTPLGGKVLTFVPISDETVHAAIPTVLINADYVHLARLWILKPRSIPEDLEKNVDLVSYSNDWTLLGKSVLFSDELSIGQMTAYGGDFKDQQRVFGRRKDMANGIPGVRERRRN
ncbi:hypothetical protein M409DRAFT_56030 [Zasmidium cellare ATCC 36951]|uniref:J domain-containing protein n=1 Tax=Zasmidium cellare ATCC 36951 TaxID=1080233 RepID=A0A6A6CGS2_ZASCE|nr:uncharacterized protein M409DRAFT_56030 [Zasmidium cellare ATCC 36951]KAF2165142.1 hypothetical protein M409DRAFT_56030 [Zasmidium cellare ATCC 36951]